MLREDGDRYRDCTKRSDALDLDRQRGVRRLSRTVFNKGGYFRLLIEWVAYVA